MPTGYYGHTCLIAAVKDKHIETAKRLLSVKEIDVNKSGKDGKTPLHWAGGKGYLEIARVKSFSCFHLIA